MRITFIDIMICAHYGFYFDLFRIEIPGGWSGSLLYVGVLCWNTFEVEICFTKRLIERVKDWIVYGG